MVVDKNNSGAAYSEWRCEGKRDLQTVLSKLHSAQHTHTHMRTHAYTNTPSQHYADKHAHPLSYVHRHWRRFTLIRAHTLFREETKSHMPTHTHQVTHSAFSILNLKASYSTDQNLWFWFSSSIWKNALALERNCYFPLKEPTPTAYVLTCRS